MIVSDLSLRCFGGGSSEAIKTIAPTGSVLDGFGNFGQIGSGDNETLGDEVGFSTVAQTPFSLFLSLTGKISNMTEKGE